MNSKRGLMTVLIGLAMLATPVAAAAKDHNRYDNSHAARVSRSFAGQGRYVAPAGVTRHEWRENHPGWNHGWAYGHAYRNYGYGNPGYYGTPVYAAPVYAAPVYAAPVYSGYGGGYGGNPCRRAQSVMYNYYKDRNTGHPAAAYDLLRQNQWALHSGCGTAAPYGGGGLLGGLGGFGGAPAYGNNVGYNGGYGGGYNSGYGGGYGQPYGGSSMLAPLLQYFH